MNDVRLQSPEGKHPVDENLRPILVGGVSTALEVSKKDVRVNNLYVNGTTTGVSASDSTKLPLTGGAMTGAITTNSTFDGIDIATRDGVLTSTTTTANAALPKAGGTMTGDITTDSDIISTDLTINDSGTITLDSATGVFEMKGAGVTAKFADMYAGMILGCTHVFGSGTAGTFVTISTAWDNLLWDTDKYALVTFVVPPSNKVKISVHLPWAMGGGHLIQLGLADDSGDPPHSIGTKYENDVDDANRSDSFNINYSWVVEGSDHGWSAGDTETLYIIAYTASTVRFYTGGTNTSAYGGVIVEATALPATIGNGEEP